MLRSKDISSFTPRFIYMSDRATLEDQTQELSRTFSQIEKAQRINLRSYLERRNDNNPLDTLNEMGYWLHFASIAVKNLPVTRMDYELVEYIDQVTDRIERQLATITVNHILALKITSSLIDSLPDHNKFGVVHRSARFIAKKLVFEEYPLPNFLKYIEALIKVAVPDEITALDEASGLIAELDIRLALG